MYSFPDIHTVISNVALFIRVIYQKISTFPVTKKALMAISMDLWDMKGPISWENSQKLKVDSLSIFKEKTRTKNTMLLVFHFC